MSMIQIQSSISCSFVIVQANWTIIQFILTRGSCPITHEHINSRKCSIIKDSKEELTFIKDLIISIRNINASNMSDVASLDRAVNKFANAVENV